MNIGENYYCSRCFAKLPDEEICSCCGHDPEKKYAGYLLEEGTLLNNGRYQTGVLIWEDAHFCWYAAWDYKKERPVIAEEFFPKDLIGRNILIDDNVQIFPGKEKKYKLALDAFFKCMPPGDERIPIDSFVSHGTGYRIFRMMPRSDWKFFREQEGRK